MTKEEIKELFVKCNDNRKRLEVDLSECDNDEWRYNLLKGEIAFNNGQMNIIRKLLDEE